MLLGSQYRGADRDRWIRLRRRSRARQQAVCQCRRSPASASASGQATTCGVTGRMSWSQPGHRYGFVLERPVIRRTW
jgi:hypothetical protein